MDSLSRLHGFHRTLLTLADEPKPRPIEVYVKGDQGPPLILLHELPGLSEPTFALGDFFVKQGFRVLLPLLFGRAGEENMARSLLQVCLRRELLQLWRGADSPVISAIRQLAAREWQAYSRREPTATGVAVVGMCFTGSMVLALLLDQSSSAAPIAAPVMAQPSSGFSSRALQAARQGDIRGPVLALRFQKDWICSPAHFGRLEQAFAGCPAQAEGLIVHEFEGAGHSTLVYDYDPDHPRRDLRSPLQERLDAREVVCRFVQDQLGREPAAGRA